MSTLDEIHAAQVFHVMTITRRHNDWRKNCRLDLKRYRRIHRKICGRSYRVKMSLISMLPESAGE